MVEAGVSGWWTIAKEQAKRCDSPEGHLNPLMNAMLDEIFARTTRNVTHVELTPPSCRVGLSEGAHDHWSSDGSKGSSDVHDTLGHYRSVSVCHEGLITCLGLLGLHLFGVISLGTAYARATDENPIPIKIWATINR